MNNETSKRVKVALYARASTLLRQDPNLQITNMKEFAVSRGFEIAETYVDRISGEREKRPGLDQMIKDARAGKFKILIVTGIDRLGRSTRHLIGLVEELHESYGVSLISLRESIDFSTATGKMALTMLSAVAQLERQLISERISTSLAAKKLAAQQDGTSWRCGRPVVATTDVAQKVTALRSQGVSIRNIAKDTGVSTATVQRILKAKSS